MNIVDLTPWYLLIKVSWRDKFGTSIDTTSHGAMWVILERGCGELTRFIKEFMKLTVKTST